MVDVEREVRLERLAIRLGRAWKSCARIGPVAEIDLPHNREEAHFVQDAMFRETGEPISGWMVGATSARMREVDGHEDVVPGRIFQSVTWQGVQHALPADRFPEAKVEAEFGFQLLEDLSARDTPWSLDELAEISTLYPAVEIIGNRHDLRDASKQVRSLMTVADNGGGIGFVFGEPASDWKKIDLRSQPVALSVDRGQLAENFPPEFRCDPLEALAGLVQHLAGRGFQLEAGQFISTGSACIRQPVGPESRVSADFGCLGRIDIEFAREDNGNGA